MNESPAFRFTSGQWTGFLNSRSETRQPLDVLLRFEDNHVSGVGNDENGMFVLSGDYDPPANECRWIQTYVFGTTVFYRGFCENRRIWGTWKSTNQQHGGFELRPTANAATTGTRSI